MQSSKLTMQVERQETSGSMRLSGAATSRPGALSKSGSDAEGSLRRRSVSGLNGHHRVGEGTGAGPGPEVRDRTREESPSHCHRSVASTRSANRRRTLIQNYNDEDEDNTAPPSQVAQFKEQITPYQDVDIDMQLEDVSPEHGGSSLQISTSYDEYLAAPNQAAKPLDRHDTINLAEATPPASIHKSPRKEVTSDSQSAKRRRSEGEGHTRTSDSSHPQHLRTKEAIPSIDIVSQMWLGFTIHEAIATQQGTDIIQEHRTFDEFTIMGTPPSEVIEFQTLR